MKINCNQNDTTNNTNTEIKFNNAKELTEELIKIFTTISDILTQTISGIKNQALNKTNINKIKLIIPDHLSDDVLKN